MGDYLAILEQVKELRDFYNSEINVPEGLELTVEPPETAVPKLFQRPATDRGIVVVGYEMVTTEIPEVGMVTNGYELMITMKRKMPSAKMALAAIGLDETLRDLVSRKNAFYVDKSDHRFPGNIADMAAGMLSGK